MININRAVISGHLTKDPDLRSLPSGTSVCKLRMGCNTRRKDRDGNWVDKPNYFDVVVWAGQGESCAKYLKKGSGLLVDGRLEWREWETDNGGKRQSVEIVAETVQFLNSPSDSDSRDGGGYSEDVSKDQFSGSQSKPNEDDDIPF